MTVDWQFILAIHVYPYFLQIDLLWDFSLLGIHLSKFIFPFGYVALSELIATYPPGNSPLTSLRGTKQSPLS